jgi:hypothetical protein
MSNLQLPVDDELALTNADRYRRSSICTQETDSVSFSTVLRTGAYRMAKRWLLRAVRAVRNQLVEVAVSATVHGVHLRLDVEICVMAPAPGQLLHYSSARRVAPRRAVVSRKFMVHAAARHTHRSAHSINTHKCPLPLCTTQLHRGWHMCARCQFASRHMVTLLLVDSPLGTCELIGS